MTEAMTIPANKMELLAFMQDQWNGFVRASDALPDNVWLTTADAAGWSIRDHVGHVMVWTRAEIPLLTDGTPIPKTPDTGRGLEFARSRCGQRMVPANTPGYVTGGDSRRARSGLSETGRGRFQVLRGGSDQTGARKRAGRERPAVVDRHV